MIDLSREMNRVLSSAKMKIALLNKLKIINDFVNSNIFYKADDNKNKWQTLEESLELGTGDCEDIAIAKYFMLRLIGIEGRLTHVYSDRTGHHMVLLVSDFILDNASYDIVDIEDSEYQFIYMFNHSNCYSCDKNGLNYWPIGIELSKWNNVLENTKF